MVERKVDIKVSVTGENSLQQLDAATVKLAQDTKKAEAELEKFEKQQKDMGRTIDNNGLIYNKNGKIIVQATNNYRQLNHVASTTASTLKTKLTPAAKGVNGALSGFGRSAGQAGIQVQQFTGQITGGQDAFQAFGAQAADLGFVLGAPLLGAVLGIAAAIGGTLVKALSGSKKEVKDFTFSLDELTESMDELAKLSRSQLRLALIGADEQLEQIEKQLTETSKEVRNYSEQLDSGSKNVTRLAKNGNAYISTVKLTDEELKKLNKEYNQAAANVDKLNQEKAKLIKLQLDSAKVLAGETIEQGKQRKVVDELVASIIAQNEAYGLSTEAITINSLIKAKASKEDIEAVRISFERVNAINAETEALKAKDAVEKSLNSLKSALSSPEERLEAQADLRTELVDTGIAMGNISVEEGAEYRLAIWAEYHEKLAALEDKSTDATTNNAKRHADILANIQLSAASNAFATIATFAKKGSALQKIGFIASKGLQAAVALNSSRVAALGALAPPPIGLGVVAGAPVAASIRTAGAINAALILAQGIGGSGGGGGSSVSTASTDTPSSAGLTEPTLTTQTQVNNIGSTELLALRNELASLDPDEVLPVAFTRRLIASIGSATSEGTA